MYGDVAPRNILINKDSGRLVFCDMDNIKLDNFEMDLVPPTFYYYSESRGIDDGVQPYMHNIMTLKAFGLDMLCSTNYELKKYFKRTGRKIVDSMKKPDNFNDEYIIEHIKKRVLKK